MQKTARPVVFENHHISPYRPRPGPPVAPVRSHILYTVFCNQCLSWGPGTLSAVSGRRLSSAATHGAALTSDGRVVTWGSAEGGRLGRKRPRGVGEASHARPATVAIPVSGENVVSVSAGGALSGVSGGASSFVSGGALSVSGAEGLSATFGEGAELTASAVRVSSSSVLEASTVGSVSVSGSSCAGEPPAGVVVFRRLAAGASPPRGPPPPPPPPLGGPSGS